jgi:hypothetical protein
MKMKRSMISVRRREIYLRISAQPTQMQLVASLPARRRTHPMRPVFDKRAPWREVLNRLNQLGDPMKRKVLLCAIG